MTQDKTGGPPPGQFEFKKRQATIEQKSDPILAKQYMDNPQFDLTAPSELYQPVHRKGKQAEGDLNSVTAFDYTWTRV